MKKIIGLFILLLLVFSNADAETLSLDLAQAVGNTNATYSSASKVWELGRSGWVSIVENQSSFSQGTFNGTMVDSQGRIVLNLAGGSCSGEFISRVIDLSQTSQEETLSYTMFVPSGATGTLFIRHGTSPSAMGSWSQVPSTGFALRNVIGNSNYIQYRVQMASNAVCGITPNFSGLSIMWLGFTNNVGRVSTAKVDDIYGSLVKGISVNQNEPSGTQIRWAVSDNNGTTVKRYQNGVWVIISDVASQGNTASELQSIPESAWKNLSQGFLRVFFSLKTEVNYVSPTVSSIVVNYTSPEVDIGSISCPPKLYVQEAGDCRVVATSNIGTLNYQWTGPSDMELTPNGSQARILFKGQGRKTLKVRALIGEIPTVFGERITQVEVVTPPKPRVTLTGPKGVRLGENATYEATYNCPEGMTCNFRMLVDGIPQSGQTIDVTFRELGKHLVIAQAWDPNVPNSLGESSISVFVSEVPKPFISFNVPKKVEIGVPFDVSVRLSAPYGNPVGYWVLPDGNRAVENTVTYTATQKADIKFRYVAWIDGFDYTRTEAESNSVRVDVYTMPKFTIKSFQKLDKPIYAPYGAFFGVEGNIGGAKDFGVNLTHQWDFGDGTVIEGGEPARAGHTYAEAGTYTVTLRVFDDRGNESMDSLRITVLDPPPIVVDFKTVSSNKFNRAPVKVFLKPFITGGHPALDKVNSYVWSVNGIRSSDARMLNVTFDEPGEYEVSLTVQLKTGKIAEASRVIQVNPNQLPQCNISYQDYPKFKYTKISASCSDPDGKVKTYQWDLGDGTTSDKANVFAKYMNSGIYEVTLTVTDDSGGQAVFNTPIRVVR